MMYLHIQRKWTIKIEFNPIALVQAVLILAIIHGIWRGRLVLMGLELVLLWQVLGPTSKMLISPLQFKIEIGSSQGESTQPSVHSPMSTTRSIAQRFISWYPPTMPQHLCDAIVSDFEEVCAKAIEEGDFWRIYRFEVQKLQYEIAYAWLEYGSERFKRYVPWDAIAVFLAVASLILQALSLILY